MFFSAVTIFFLLSCLFCFFSLLSLLFLSLISLELIFDYPLYSLEFLSLCLCSCPFASLYMTFFCLSIYLHACLLVCLPGWLSICLLSACIFLSVCIWFCMSISLLADLFLCHLVWKTDCLQYKVSKYFQRSNKIFDNYRVGLTCKYNSAGSCLPKTFCFPVW